jgi:hypothetical protein
MEATSSVRSGIYNQYRFCPRVAGKEGLYSQLYLLKYHLVAKWKKTPEVPFQDYLLWHGLL